MFGQGKKIISFGLGSLNKKWCIKNGLIPINKFGYPGKFKNNGFCWSNISDEPKINRLLSNIISMKQSEFDRKIKVIKKKLCFMILKTQNLKNYYVV